MTLFNIHPYDSFMAFSLWQPWATLVALGKKKIETRQWFVKHRGVIAIYATKSFPTEARAVLKEDTFRDALGPWADNLPRGAIVGLAQIVDCRKMITSDPQPYVQGWNVPQRGDFIDSPEMGFGYYDAGRTLTYFQTAVWFNNPIPTTAPGQSPIWPVPPLIGREIVKELLTTSKENFSGDSTLGMDLWRRCME